MPSPCPPSADRAAPFAGRWLLLVALGFMAAGCEPADRMRPGDVRTYSVPKNAEPAIASAPSVPQPSTPSQRPLHYETPSGWTDRGGSGMRLATLAIGDAEGGHEVTVIAASGSLESNVQRWAGQLDATASPESLAERAADAIAAAETIDVDEARATVVALRGNDNADGKAILAAMIPLDDGSALFVKFMGDATTAEQERDRFVQFVRSIRWKE